MIPSKVGPVDETTTAAIIQRFYDLGVYPDWWKLEPSASEEAWKGICQAIARNDPHVRGIVVLGLDAAMEDLEASFAIAAGFDLVKGFAVGRTIFAGPARRWFSGEIDDATAVAEMADVFARLCAIWDAARARGGQIAGNPAGKQGLAV